MPGLQDPGADGEGNMSRLLSGFVSGALVLAAFMLLGSLSGFTSWVSLAVAQEPLLVDGDFESNETGKQLRKREEPQGWYESRKDTKEGSKLLKLSTKKIGRNATKKAMIKASPQFNTYLSQRLAESQDGRFSLMWDIYVRQILPPYNRSAFQMLGNDSVRKRGPNATGAERFVFLAFENAAVAGKINLFAFEGGEQWDKRKLLVPNLDLKRWYTVCVDVDVQGEAYLVSMPGVTEKPLRVQAYETKKKPIPKVLTHISFASWNDGPGTFYIDNVRRP